MHISSLFQDPDDLPFRKGEVLTVVSKDEEQWWTARNALGQTGSIPVPYIAKVSNEKKVICSWNSLKTCSLDSVTCHLM